MRAPSLGPEYDRVQQSLIEMLYGYVEEEELGVHNF
jgi:hypothetical protein